MQLGCGYKKVEKPRDQAVCDNFLDVLRNGPNDAIKMAYDMYENPGKANKFMKDLQEKVKEQVEEETVDLDN